MILQKKINELNDMFSTFLSKEEKIQKLESLLKEKEQTLLDSQLKIKELENLFEKRLEINREDSEEQNREVILKLQKEKEIQMKVLFLNTSN